MSLALEIFILGYFLSDSCVQVRIFCARPGFVVERFIVDFSCETPLFVGS